MKHEGDTLVYTEAEKKIVADRDTFLASELAPVAACRYALFAAPRVPSKEFIEHFSEGALTKTDGKVVIVRS